MISSEPLAGLSRRSWRAVLGAAAVVAASLYGAANAGAESAAQDEVHLGLKLLSDSAAHDELYRGVKPLPDSQLRQLRGGFTFGALQFDFAAWVKVLINGDLVAHTKIVWNGSQFAEMDGGGTVAPPAGVSISPFMQQGPVGLKGLKISRDGDSKSSFALHSINVQHTLGAVINQIKGTGGESFQVEQQIGADLTINNFNQLRGNLLGGAAIGNLAKAGVPDSMMFGN
jgi:hypothetical protein